MNLILTIDKIIKRGCPDGSCQVIYSILTPIWTLAVNACIVFNLTKQNGPDISRPP
ncbi:hypothetical protein GA0116948_104321 [Chitinophaga costaii]|uniref:Uncharacterized protein n=1 Tax=Chitinophaga costaii TaxID=1335309 RepID=A0A1C4CV90_9BACT|nr:hypothetical protein [Chitinophaga costaii]SCC23094.1 hypothetical protein GA0116948_104321 [Chitinophaga costaii]